MTRPPTSPLLLFVLVATFSCSSPTKDTRPGKDLSEDSGAPGTPLVWVQTPSFEEPTPGLFFARWLTLQTSVPTTIKVELEEGGESLTRAFPEPAYDHQLPILELWADASFSVTVTATDDRGHTVVHPLILNTQSMPEDFPILEPLVHHPDRMEPGLTLFSLEAVEASAWVCSIDEKLRVRWILDVHPYAHDLRLGDEGDLWIVGGKQVIRQTVMGDIVGAWGPQTKGKEDLEFHHEAFPLGEGAFLSLARSSQWVDAYPMASDPTRPGAAALVYVPTLAELEADGTIRTWIDLGEVLDLQRVGFDSHDRTPVGLDWGHANAVFPDGPDHWIVSFRHQDTLIRLGRDGQLDWILANPDGWSKELDAFRLTPVGESFAWPFHQHGPERDRDGGLVVFDNGNHRATPYGTLYDDRPPYSRIVRYVIDSDARTVRQDWSIDATSTGRVYSWAMGDADMQPTTGHVLGVYGLTTAEADLPHVDQGWGKHAARIVEVHPERPEDFVLDLRVRSDYLDRPIGWRVYRAERIPRMHPSIP